MSASILLTPDAAPLSAWHDIYRGGNAVLESTCRPGFQRAAAVVEAIVAKGEPVYQPSVNSIPTSADQEDQVSTETHGARGLLSMDYNAADLVGIELLAAAQGCDFHAAALASRPALRLARTLLHARVPAIADDHHFAPKLAEAANPVTPGGEQTV